MTADHPIIFSDLDGTLLDHHSYRFDAALPALDALRATAIPLILTSSKTLAEVAALNAALSNPQPVIVENGGAMCFPLDRAYPFEIDLHECVDGYAVVRFAPPYAALRAFIETERQQHGWPIRGFGDMTSDTVAAATQLSTTTAEMAKQRLCSEPFVWHGSSQDLTRFRERANTARLRLTHGGRFWHLMGDTCKASAMNAMCALFATERGTARPVIALGDSENDSDMLRAADIAVVVRRHDGTYIDARGLHRTLHTERPGPAGWNAAVLQLLNEWGRHGVST